MSIDSMSQTPPISYGGYIDRNLPRFEQDCVDAYDLKRLKAFSRHLRYLTIYNYDFHHANDLAKLLKSSPNISALNLRTGDSSPEDFAKVIAELPNMESLDLSDALWDRNADAILEALCKHCPKLRNLVLWFRCDLPGDGAIPFSAIEEHHSRYTPSALQNLHRNFGDQLEVEHYYHRFHPSFDRWRRIDFS